MRRDFHIWTRWNNKLVLLFHMKKKNKNLKLKKKPGKIYATMPEKTLYIR